ncbi:ATP-dependent helicase/deoxyribonuclease subunit B [Labeo rohita]|uniref:ATP-dependent helicase/deoxyribonuclease subunit B n=1 Tax=Labeo rohita TaxID=84645 RepID=A0ABQ8L8M8_LABRO|nr:ATP-dependent helicase/deoxyribonuclease subunit B [Labeo rohita]
MIKMYFKDRTTVRKQSLSKVNFANYKAIVSFVNIDNVHWKFLYISAAECSVYLVDPLSNPAEEAESKAAAQKFCEYFQIRNIRHRDREWANVEFKGAVMKHPVQQDGYNCGVIVIMMAKAVMKAFPKLPNMEFGTTPKEMAQERTALALEILQASGMFLYVFSLFFFFTFLFRFLKYKMSKL